ncbi:hypothetical protein [Ktedonosporobacter rubrisoli]|uniref:hypothetical protein n=1 Tax=Ktedonosporobacter rubrisoli TaxID=2509675 RepID=UPI001F5D5405|nr:hypothetical protein [Ktedonosporobacter rubrisoli]
MTAHKDFFDPGTVDEQIDELLTMQETTEPMSEQRFAHDLQQILASNEEDKRSLQLVLNRLAESNVQQQHQPLTLLPKIPSQRMQQPLSGMLNLTKYTPRSPLLRALNILVAVMVVAALVGSIFILLRSISLYNAQISTQPQEMQSQHLGQVVYRSNGYDMARGPQWSPDGKRIAAAIDNQVVKSWDAMSGKNVITYPSGGKRDLYTAQVGRPMAKCWQSPAAVSTYICLMPKAQLSLRFCLFRAASRLLSRLPPQHLPAPRGAQPGSL